MVWQENVGCIMMLANLVEEKKKKVELYWPEEIKAKKTYGKIS